MRIYVEAYRGDGSQILGNGDGQTIYRDLKDYRRTKHYQALVRGFWKRPAYWRIVTDRDVLLETVIQTKENEYATAHGR